MTREILDAVYEKGAFRLLRLPASELVEGQHVRLLVQAEPEASEEILKMAAEVYQGLSTREISELEELILNRRTFFEYPVSR